MMITVTERAAQQIKKAAEQGGTQHMALRIAATRQPDGSIKYAMGFDDPQANDQHIESEGIEILVGEDSKDLLEGTTLDFVELEEGDFQFIFMNPNDPDYSPPTEA